MQEALQTQEVLREAHEPGQAQEDGGGARLRLLRREFPQSGLARRPFCRGAPQREHHQQHKRVRRHGGRGRGHERGGKRCRDQGRERRRSGSN